MCNCKIFLCNVIFWYYVINLLYIVFFSIWILFYDVLIKINMVNNKKKYSGENVVCKGKFFICCGI